MNRSSLRALLADIQESGRGQLLLRATIVGAAAIAAIITGFVGDWSITGVLAVPVLGVLVAVNPHTTAPLLLIAFVLLAWVSSAPHLWHPASLPLALALLVVHTASALAASVPAQSDLPRAVVISSIRRAALVGAVTAVAWAIAGLVTSGPFEADLAWVVVALLVLAGMLSAHFVLVGWSNENERIRERVRRRRSGVVSDPSRRS